MVKIVLDITYEELINNPKLLEKLITDDANSVLKTVQIPNSVAYYNSDNTVITNRQKYYWDYKTNQKCEDFAKANHRLPHGYHKEIVDQASNYLVGKKFDVKYDDENVSTEQEAVIEEIMFKFNEVHITAAEYLTEMQMKHFAYLYIFIDEEGMYRVKKMDTEELFMIYDTSIDQKKVAAVRRYIKLEWNEQKEDFDEVIYVDVYSNKEVTTFSFISTASTPGRTSAKKLTKVESKPLVSRTIQYENGSTESTDIGEWHAVPFVEVELDEYGKVQLDYYKEFIDMIDITLSDLANNIDDIQEVVWVLENYQGQDLSKFMTDLKDFKSIKVGAGGSVDALKNEIPTEAREKLYGALQKAIYKFGQAVDLDVAQISNVAQETLTIMFSRLDLKCDGYEIKMTRALREVFAFLADYIQYDTGTEIDLSNLEITFKRDMVVNESARIENLVKSVGMISDETIVENHPYVKDALLEMELMEAQQEEIEANMPPPPIEEEDEEDDGEEQEETDE